jgi:PAS domain S-box-containing protein
MRPPDPAPGDTGSARRLRQLIDGLFSFVGLLRPDGVLIEANRTALEAAGLSTHDVYDKPFAEAYWWNYDAGVQAQLQEAIERAGAGEPSRYDVEVRVRDGQLITIDFSLVPVMEDGEVVALIPSGIDITDRKLAAQLLRATAELTRELAAAATTDDVSRIIVTHGPAALGADFLNVGVVDGPVLRIRQPETLDTDITDRYTAVDLSAPTTITDAVTTNAIIELHDHHDHDGRYHDLYDDVVAAGLSSVAAIPIARGDGTVLGAIGVGWRTPTPIDDNLRSRLETVVQACGAALERAQRGDQQRAALDEIQRQLLPRPVAPPGFELAVRYLPATEELGFGGDWYDLIDPGDGRFVAVVGDVVGHGLEAAARMTQVRSALAALIDDEVDLPALVQRATHVLQRLTGEHTFIATAALLVVDSAAGTIHYLCAGHLPPLVRRADGRIEFLDQARTVPLGLTAPVASAACISIEPGDTLFAYTDGLIERRHEDIDTGLARLAAAVATAELGHPESAIDALLDSVLERLDRRDDVAVIALHRRA